MFLSILRISGLRCSLNFLKHNRKVLGVQLLFSIRINQPEDKYKYALLNWQLPWLARRNIIINERDLKETCTCTTQKAMLH